MASSTWAVVRRHQVLIRAEVLQNLSRWEVVIPFLVGSMVGLLAFAAGFLRMGSGSYLDILLPGWAAYAVVNASVAAAITATVELTINNVRYLRSLPLWPLGILWGKIIAAAVVGAGIALVNIVTANAIWLRLPIRQLPTMFLALFGASLAVVALMLTLTLAIGVLFNLSIITSLVITVLQYVGGVYFTPDAFPPILRPFVYLNPLTLAAQSIRALVAGEAMGGWLLRLLGVLALWSLLASLAFLRRWRKPPLAIQ